MKHVSKLRRSSKATSSVAKATHERSNLDGVKTRASNILSALKLHFVKYYPHIIKQDDNPEGA